MGTCSPNCLPAFLKSAVRERSREPGVVAYGLATSGLLVAYGVHIYVRCMVQSMCICVMSKFGGWMHVLCMVEYIYGVRAYMVCGMGV